MLATDKTPEPWAETAFSGPDTVPGVVPDRSAWSDTVAGQAASRTGGPTGGRTPGRGLCVVADDVGLHPGVNGAATDLVLSGRLQALACRVGAPYWPEVVEHLTRLRGLAVDIGLQLDLSKHPLDARVARPMRHWVLGLKRPTQGALRNEIAAQFDAFEAAMGQAPHFVAGHRHVHQVDGVRELVMDEIERRYAPGYRPWVRMGQRGGQDRLPQALRAWAIERNGALETAAAARAIGAMHNRGLLGIYNHEGGLPRFRQLLERWLRTAREGELLVCHPSVQTVVPDRRLAQRRAEHQLLASAEWPALVERMDIDLQPMSRLLAKRARW